MRQVQYSSAWRSSCRICGDFKIQQKHWISDNPLSNSIVEYSVGRWETCIPSDNLEYLEWCETNKELLDERRRYQEFERIKF